jgi:tetratricopeptide (TPR) repeat protein
MTTRLFGLASLLVLALVAGGCAASAAYRQGNSAMRAGNLDDAVLLYRKAVLADPDNPNYKIALERAMVAASRAHLDKAREFEQNDQLEAALGEYKQASEYDPSNRLSVSKVAELERTIRDRIEASRPKPAIQEMRERARAASAEPVLNPASRDPLNLSFPNTSLRDILNFIGNLTEHQHHLRPRRAGSAGHHQSERRHARAGAQPDHDDESAVVQDS